MTASILPDSLTSSGNKTAPEQFAQGGEIQVDPEMSLFPKKRERISAFFRRSTSPLPVRTAATSATTPSQGPAYTSNGSSILADALEALDRNDRETIRTLLLPANAITIDTAFDEVLGCASELQQLCVNKRWSWNYKGRQVYLFDQVNKVVQLLDKFKAGGDVVANVDPVHVGLPWAGIRAILEVCVDRRNTS